MEKLLEKYATLAVKVGVNIQPGQKLLIRSAISTADFTRLVVKKAYEAGAKDVYVLWNDEAVTRTRYDLAPDEAFTEFPAYQLKAMEDAITEGYALFNISSADPDLLKGVSPERIATANKTEATALKDFYNAIQADKVSWCIMSAPSLAWAAKVFPDLETAEEQMDALWHAIFAATRADLGDPVGAWKAHIENLTAKTNMLNGEKFHAIHLSATGTDLTIELPEKHIWVGAESYNEKGYSFVANMPTEEVFTLPKKDGVNGTVSSTKPLSYGGNLIDNFTITFKDGRIIDYTAEKGYDTLKHLIETDEGSHYLGEVALVAHSTPISASGLTFYNTLFDENASIHLAIGSAYSFNLEGGKIMTEDELLAHGANQSLTHVDFMIGSVDMDIDGIKKDGTKMPIFRNGEWV